MELDSLTWALAEGEYGGWPLLIRFREFPQSFEKSKYPERINIFWRMSEADENGLPTNEESDRVGTFEDRLVGAVEQDVQSILVGVLTCNREREFIFQTADVPGFMARLTNMPQEKERYPITIHRNEDVDWSYFTAMIPGDH